MTRSLRNAMEDARGLIAAFSEARVGDDDCLPDARRSLESLDRALARALQNAEGESIEDEDKSAVELERLHMVAAARRWSAILPLHTRA